MASSSNRPDDGVRSAGGAYEDTPRPEGKRFKNQQDEGQRKPRHRKANHSAPVPSTNEAASRSSSHASARSHRAHASESPADASGASGPGPGGSGSPGPASGDGSSAPKGGVGSHSRGVGVKPAYRRRSSEPEAKRSRVPLIIAIVAVAAVLVVAGVFVVPKVYQLFFAKEEEETFEAGVKVTVVIPEDASGDTIASVLSEAHVIEDPSDYYAAVTQLGAENSLKPGTYEFITGEDPLEVVQQLVEGPNAEGTTVVVTEGLTVEQTAEVVEESLGIDAEEFIEQAKASNYVDDYPFLEDAVDDSLEGYLYPKTYNFTEDPTADSVIRKMLDQYEEEVESLDFDSAIESIESRYGVTMTKYDILIMASIVEREALTSDQRLNIASVFYNRLELDMALQSDATMGYVTGGEVTSEDLKTESEYNTYLNKGLTPTPICSPSLESIEAAMDPADTDYLYFYITTDVEYFSETYDEHLQAIEENS